MKQIIILLLLLPIISAVPTLELQNEDIQPGETVLAKITTPGNFESQIEKSQITFMKGRKKTTLETDVLFYNSTHYIYIYTRQEENLTMQIENILYKEDETLSSITINQNLTIKTNNILDEETNETYTKILKIKPGFIFTTSTPKLKLTNLGTRTLNLTFGDEEVSLQSLASKELEFIPEEPFSLKKISTYKDFLIPTVYLKAQENTTFVSPTAKSDLRTNPDFIFLELFTENKTKQIIELLNFGDENLTDIKITHNTTFLKIPEIEDMPPRGEQNLTLELNPKTPGHFQGEIKITYSQNETENILEIPLSIFILPKGTTPENFEVKKETCSEISGEVCSQGSFCNGTATFTKNSEYCCLDTCIEEESKDSDSSGFGWLVGLVIFAILGGIGHHFYKKQKQIKPQTSKDSLQATTEKFEKRLTGENQPKRTTGNLTKS